MHKLYDEALMTHKNLSVSDRNWLVSQLDLSPNKIKDILLSYKMSMTGRLAKRYNQTLDDIANKRSIDRLKKLYSLSFVESVPELKSLNKTEKEKVMKRVNLEYSAIKNLKVESDKDQMLPHSYNDVGKTPYCQSFKLLCFQEFEMNYTPSVLSDKIYINDDEIYCFDHDEIVERLRQGNYINPITNEPFSDYAIELLEQALAIELKL